MSRIRIALIVTMLLGSIYASAGLLTSLRDFGIGIAVASAALVAYGLCEWIEER